MNLSINKSYTFNTRAPAILGARIQNAKLLGILDYTSARQHDNIDLKYRTIFPLLPQGTPDQPDSCVYYRFLSESNEKIIIADQWIEESSIEVVEHVNFQVTFTQASLQDIPRVRDALSALGFSNFNIRQL